MNNCDCHVLDIVQCTNDVSNTFKIRFKHLHTRFLHRNYHLNIQSCVKSFSRNHLIVIEFVQNEFLELYPRINPFHRFILPPRSKIFHTRRVVDPADREQTAASAAG